MKLYMLTLTPDALLRINMSILDVCGMVVAAPSEARARELAYNYADFIRETRYSPDWMTNESFVRCEELSASAPGVYLAN